MFDRPSGPGGGDFLGEPWGELFHTPSLTAPGELVEVAGNPPPPRWDAKKREKLAPFEHWNLALFETSVILVDLRPFRND